MSNPPPISQNPHFRKSALRDNPVGFIELWVNTKSPGMRRRWANCSAMTPRNKSSIRRRPSARGRRGTRLRTEAPTVARDEQGYTLQLKRLGNRQRR
ncbi:hypothetical protein ACNKHO_22045 [Shigella flexneri]